MEPDAVRPRPIHYLDGTGARVSQARRPLALRLFRIALVLGCLVGLAGATGVVSFLWLADRAPREWAPYLQRRAEQHRWIIVAATDLVASWLTYADRLPVAVPPRLPQMAGAAESRSGALPAGRIRPVDSLPALNQAMASAQPDDVILLAPGRYRVGGYSLKAARSGTASSPITVRAERLGDVVIESEAVETFKVIAPYWRFENLVMIGVCADHSACEHAIHVTGPATGVSIRNNRIEDFNAHLKINGEGGQFPDGGVIENNTLTDTAPRFTFNPVTPIDLVAASNWRITGNIITDFARGLPGNATYGAFVKGAGEANVMERNVVVCEWKLRGVSGQHVGLSLGGGGTDLYATRDGGRTGLEQIGGVIRDNLIAGCSDDGIYLNRAARSIVDHNTLIDTAGIDARFIETSATVTANMVDGLTRSRNGARLSGRDNDIAWTLGLFAGLHPQRAYFQDPAALDLTWRKEPGQAAEAEPRLDLCGRQWGMNAPVGAFADYAPCLLRQ